MDVYGESLQERYFPGMTCFGCGPANVRGLRLRSYAVDEGIEARFQPWPEHDNGLGWLNGGIIATLLDCHAAAAVVVETDRLGLAPDGTLQYVTAGLDVRFRRPGPLDAPVTLLARVVSADEAAVTAESELWWDDRLRASATSLWKRFRPRPGTHAA